MDKLQSLQDQLCRALSGDPDYILRQCGNMLTMNEFFSIQNQSSPYDKMKVLLKITFERGDETCQSFLDILRTHQSHYQQLPQLVNTSTGGSSTPTVADGNSVVTNRELTNVTAKNLNMKIETVSGPGSRPAENAVEQTPQAVHTARNSSILCADKISDCTFAGDMDLSVSAKTSSTVDDTLPSPQEVVDPPPPHHLQPSSHPVNRVKLLELP